MIADRVRHQRLDLLFVASVAFEVATVEVGANHRRALVAEQLDGRLADTGAGARDDGDFTLEAHGKLPISFGPSEVEGRP